MSERTTRAEHGELAKARARPYLDRGDWMNAWGSFISDLGKHEETRGHPAAQLGMGLILIGELNSVQAMREFIEGAN